MTKATPEEHADWRVWLANHRAEQERKRKEQLVRQAQFEMET